MTQADTAAALPAPQTFFSRLVGISAVDAVLCGEPDGRLMKIKRSTDGTRPSLFEFDTEAGAWVRAYFRDGHALVLGFSRDSDRNPLSSPAVDLSLRGVPEILIDVTTDPDLYLNGTLAVTFAFASTSRSGEWRSSMQDDPNSSELDDGGVSELLSPLLPGNESDLLNLLSEYYEVEIDRDDISPLLNAMPIADAEIARLNPDADIDYVRAELRSMGYPL